MPLQPLDVSALSAAEDEVADASVLQSSDSVEPQAPGAEDTLPTPPPPVRTLHWRNFAAALREITPSASESLGTLADLRKWNEEFGEGRAERKRQVWGKGRFGFTVQALEGDEGKVQPSTNAGASPSS